MKPIAAAMIKDRTVRSNQIRKISFIFTGMSVDSRQGMEAEKNKMADTLVTAIANFVTISLFTTSMDGRNISAISIAAAFAASIGSGRRKSQVTG